MISPPKSFPAKINRRKLFSKSLPKPRTGKPLSGFAVKNHRLLEAGSFHAPHKVNHAHVTETGLTEEELLSTLNYLDEAALLRFNGIGPVIAKNILEYRKATRYFGSLEELLNVPLIGPFKFKQLIGRDPIIQTLPLHYLMRLNPKKPLTMDQLQPWRSPAPDIKEIWLLSKADAENYEKTHPEASLKISKIGSFRLIVHCKQEPEGRRATYITKNLPHILRSIYHERSFATTN